MTGDALDGADAACAAGLQPPPSAEGCAAVSLIVLWSLAATSGRSAPSAESETLGKQFDDRVTSLLATLPDDVELLIALYGCPTGAGDATAPARGVAGILSARGDSARVGSGRVDPPVLSAATSTGRRPRLHRLPAVPLPGDALRAAAVQAVGERLGCVVVESTSELRRVPALLQAARQGDAAVAVASDDSSTPGRLLRWLGTATAALFGGLLGIAPPAARNDLVLVRRRDWDRLQPRSSSVFAVQEIPTTAGLLGLSTTRRHDARPAVSAADAGADSSDSTAAGPPAAGDKVVAADDDAAGRGRGSWREAAAVASDAVRCAWNRCLFAGAPPAATERESCWSKLGLLGLIAGLMLLTGLDAPLTEPDEGRHAEIAREMWASGDWLAPQFLYEPYLDKPPLLYWLCSLSFTAFGPEVWAARLVPACCALATVLAVYLFGRRLVGDAAAWLGALVLSLSLGFVACGRFLILEIVLTSAVTCALLTGGIALTTDRRARGWWALSAVCCGLGALTKGPLALLLALPPLAAFAWLRQHPAARRWRAWFAYGLIAGGMALPWFVAVLIRRPEFFRYFFWEHNLKRFLNGADHPEPVWFFAPVVLIGLMPWTLALVWTGRFVLSARDEDRRLRMPALGFLMLWAGWVIGFFTLAAGKLPYYILSSFPALCLAIGVYLAQVGRVWGTAAEAAAIQDRLRRNVGLLSAAGIVVGPVLWGMRLIEWPLCVALILSWTAACVVVLTYRWRWSARVCWRVFCGLAFAGIGMLTHLALAGWQTRYAVLTPEQTTAWRLDDRSVPIACLYDSWGSIPFYTGRDDIRELAVLDPETLEKLLAGSGRARFLLHRSMPLDALRAVTPAGVELRTLTTTRRVTLVEVARLTSGSLTRSDGAGENAVAGPSVDAPGPQAKGLATETPPADRRADRRGVQTAEGAAATSPQ